MDQNKVSRQMDTMYIEYVPVSIMKAVATQANIKQLMSADNFLHEYTTERSRETKAEHIQRDAPAIFAITVSASRDIPNTTAFVASMLKYDLSD